MQTFAHVKEPGQLRPRPQATGARATEGPGQASPGWRLREALVREATAPAARGCLQGKSRNHGPLAGCSSLAPPVRNRATAPGPKTAGPGASVLAFKVRLSPRSLGARGTQRGIHWAGGLAGSFSKAQEATAGCSICSGCAQRLDSSKEPKRKCDSSPPARSADGRLTQPDGLLTKSVRKTSLGSPRLVLTEHSVFTLERNVPFRLLWM